MDKWLDQIKGRWQGRTKNGASSQPSKPNDLGKKLMDIVREKGYYTLNIETFGENTIVDVYKRQLLNPTTHLRQFHSYTTGEVDLLSPE